MLMGILLVTQFNSFYQTFLVLSSVVMSTVGVLLGLILTGQPFSAIMTGVGIVALAGIIVNNNIVLIDTFNELRQSHPEWTLRQTATHTGCLRLRPAKSVSGPGGSGWRQRVQDLSTPFWRSSSMHALQYLWPHGSC